MKTVMRLALLCIALVGAIASAPVRAHGDEPHGKASEAQSPIAEAPEGRSTPIDPVNAAADENPAHEPHPVIETLTMLHTATVHFPIALLLVAAALEALLIVRPQAGVEQSIRIILYCAAFGTVIAALFGWIHTGMWMGGDALMQRHRWVGKGLAVFSLGLVWLASRPANHGRGALRVSLAICAIAVLFQGYWGAELSHGPHHLSQGH